MKNCRIGIIGVGQRGCAYLKLAKTTPGAELVALCDTNPERMRDFSNELDCSDVPCFTDINELLEANLIDAAVITVPDFQHSAVAKKVMQAGVHVMLEKPMAPTVEGCREIIEAYNKSEVIMQLGFVLREHPLYKKVKEIVASGRLGQIMSVSATEALGVMHGASYMRRWHRKVKNSGGFVMAKCSHDLDLLSWIIDSVPVSVASFGDINFFKPQKQTAKYCSQCTLEDCRFRFKGEMVVMSKQEKENPSQNNFDLCVYNDDKDIVDSQVTILNYANGVNATFSLELFADKGRRTIAITGTEGHLKADTESGLIEINSSTGPYSEEIGCKSVNDSGHGGSDLLFFEEFLKCINTNKMPNADFRAGLYTTVIGEAIEKARREKSVVEISQQSYQC